MTGYYILDYFTGKVYSDKITAIKDEFNSTFLCENYFAVVLNAEKVTFIIIIIIIIKLSNNKKAYAI